MPTFELEEFWIDEDGDEPKSVLCEVDLTLISFGEAPAPASLNYPGDPGEPPEYEIEEITLTDVQHGETKSDAHISLSLSETQFITFFSNGADVVNNAYEWASEQEIDYGDYED